MAGRIATIVVGVTLLVGLVGCGGGGGAPFVAPDIDLETAMAIPDATDPAAGGQTCEEALEALEENGPPEDADALEAELAAWVASAQANPNDTACQLGLALVILATGAHNAADYLGYNLFDELDIQATAAMGFNDELSPSGFVSNALKTALVKGMPRLPGRASEVEPSNGGPPSVIELQLYRQAIKQHLLEPLEDSVERLAAIADLADPAELLLSLEVDGETSNLYAADVHCLVAALQFIRCGALMVSSVNPNYGSYNWDLDSTQRDSNNNGILTVAEYAPPYPFSNIDAAPWTQAGDCLHDGIVRLGQAIEHRQGDADEPVEQALQGVDAAELHAYLEDAGELLGGEVNVTVEHIVAPTVNGGSTEIPFNLRELWDNPPASFRALLPPLLEDPPDSGRFQPDLENLPDDTFSGVFPDPEAIWDLAEADYEIEVIRYGLFELEFDAY